LNKILLLEDDPLLGKTLKKFLEKNSFEVVWAKNGEEAETFSYNETFLLYLFDINVPLYNGDDLLLDLRDSGDRTPCLLISALIDIKSITKGFQSGADDYIKKPFDPQELLVRIQAKTAMLQESIKYGEYELFLTTQNITYKGEEYLLSHTQKNIFIALLKNYPNLVIKEELLLFLESQNSLALRVNITKLKQKLAVDIQNVRGVGYKLA